MHEILGHESVTEPFLDAISILDGRTGQPLPKEALKLLQGRSSEVADSLTTWIDVDIPPGPGETVWISLGGMGAGTSFAVAIPRDLESSMPVRLDVGFRRKAKGWTVDSLGARLGEPQGNDSHSILIWRPLWELQRIEAFSDLGAAGLSTRQLTGLQVALYEKGMSPVGAAIAASTLIRSGNAGFLHDWPRNLADRFPWLPDGGILWSETVLRRIEAERRAQESPTMTQDEARQYFIKGASHGAPLLTATLRMAIDQMRLWRSTVGPAHPADPELERAFHVIEKAARHLVSGSLFASFVGRSAHRSINRLRSSVLSAC
jgi:hypothetical protein